MRERHTMTVNLKYNGLYDVPMPEAGSPAAMREHPWETSRTRQLP
jgi:hypothetical protein